MLMEETAYGNKFVPCKQQADQEGIPSNSGKAMEGSLLEQELLLDHDRRYTP